MTAELTHTLLLKETPAEFVRHYWASLSSCLTDLSICFGDPSNCERVLETELLNQLARLSKLEFEGNDRDRSNDEAHALGLALPELKALHISRVKGMSISLNCPRLTDLQIADCSPSGQVSLQAALQRMRFDTTSGFALHEGFPLSNLLRLTCLKVNCSFESEHDLFQGLTLMLQLETLELVINKCRLPDRLPRHLREVALRFRHGQLWNMLCSNTLTALQKLAYAETIHIHVDMPTIYYDSGLAGTAEIDVPLSPFIAMKRLRILELGDKVVSQQIWKPSALRALGRFEGELARSGSKLDFTY